jgi:hypothetical protein
MTQIIYNLAVSQYQPEAFPPHAEEYAIQSLLGLQVSSELLPQSWQTISTKKLNTITERIIQNLIVTGKEYMKNLSSIGSLKALIDAVNLIVLIFNTKQFTVRLLKKNIVGLMTTLYIHLPIHEECVQLLSDIASFLALAITISPELYDKVETDSTLFNKVCKIMFECISKNFTATAFSSLQVLNRMSMHGPTLLVRITKVPEYNSIIFISFLLQRIKEFRFDRLDALDVYVHLMDTFVLDPGTEKFVEMFINQKVASYLVSLVPIYIRKEETDPLMFCAVLDIIGGMMELAKSSRYLTHDEMVILVNESIPSGEQDVHESGVSLIDAITEVEQDRERLRQLYKDTNAVQEVIITATTDLNDINISSQFIYRVLHMNEAEWNEKIGTHLKKFLSTAFVALLESKDISSILDEEETQVAQSVIKLVNKACAILGDSFVTTLAETFFNDILVLISIDKSAQVRGDLVLTWNKMLKTVY